MQRSLRLSVVVAEAAAVILETMIFKPDLIAYESDDVRVMIYHSFANTASNALETSAAFLFRSRRLLVLILLSFQFDCLIPNYRYTSYARVTGAVLAPSASGKRRGTRSGPRPWERTTRASL